LRSSGWNKVKAPTLTSKSTTLEWGAAESKINAKVAPRSRSDPRKFRMDSKSGPPAYLAPISTYLSRSAIRVCSTFGIVKSRPRCSAGQNWTRAYPSPVRRKTMLR